MSKPKALKMTETEKTVAELLPDFLGCADPCRVMAQEIAPMLSDQDFEDTYGVRGPMPVSPKMLALVTLFQFMEKLPDRQAAHMVKMRLDWKFALGLPLEYVGFHFCILSEFRARLVASQKAHLVFDRVLERLKELGLVRAGGKQRLDATHVLGCVGMLSRVEVVTESLRKCVEEVADVLGEEQVVDLLGEPLLGFATTRPDLRKLNDKQRRRTLGEAGRYAVAVLEAVDRHADPLLRRLAGVHVLRQVVRQQFRVVSKVEDSPGRVEDLAFAGANGPWREEVVPLSKQEQKQTPGAEKICTPHDPQARYGEKRGKGWVGYKVEIAETAEANQPNFITEVQVQNAAESDREALQPVVERLEEREILPRKMYVDQGYTSGEKIDTMQQKYGVDLRGAVREEPARGVFPQSAFQIDEDRQIVVCPKGKESVNWSQGQDDDIQIQFATSDCAHCPLRDQCTKGKGPRHLTVNAHYKTLQARRTEQKQADFIQEMHSRSAIEGTISENKRGRGLDRARYRGTAKFNLQALFSGAATNVVRLARALAAPRKALAANAT